MQTTQVFSPNPILSEADKLANEQTFLIGTASSIDASALVKYERMSRLMGIPVDYTKFDVKPNVSSEQ